MRTVTRLLFTGVLLAAPAALFVAPAVLTAPSDGDGPGIDELVADCRATGLQGWALVDHATVLVHRSYRKHSLWHLWDSPESSLRHAHGWSAQYNGALARVLTALGFQVVEVHAARVRGLGRNPWWQAGHTWLRVTHQGRTLDVSASSASNRAGELDVDPRSEVRPVHRWTRSVVSLALTPVVAVQAWRQLFGAEVPGWLHRDFDQRL